MRTISRSATSARRTAAPDGSQVDWRRGWRRSLLVGPVAVTLLLSAGCGQAAPPASLAECPVEECATETIAATIAAAIGSSELEDGRAATPRPNGMASDAIAAATPLPRSAATPVAFQTEAATLGPIVWATAIDPETRAPREPVTVIPADAATIYATIAVYQLTAGTTVTAQWSYNRTRLESFDQILVADATASDTWIEFHLALTQPGTWPEGRYAVTILVNDQPALAGDVGVISPAS